MPLPSLKAQQSERTRAALVASGRSLFAARGYAGVSAEEVALAAGVTTGAVYHQFGSKRGLFLAVFEAAEEHLTARIADAAGQAADAWDGFKIAARCFIDAASEPEVRQIILMDGRAVLGWDEWHEVMARYGLGMTAEIVRQLVEAGRLPRVPVDALAALLFGALSEGALFVATSQDSERASDEANAALEQLLEGLTAGN